jgi:hypothetical protein
MHARRLALLIFGLAGASAASACGGSDDATATHSGSGGTDAGSDASDDTNSDATSEGGPDGQADVTEASGPSGIGDPCSSDGDCGPNQTCQTNYPGGYCEAPCDDTTPCPSDATCITSQQGGAPHCLKSCTTSSECRAGYHCSQNRHVCVPSGGQNGGGVTPGTADGGACVQPIVNPPGTGAIFTANQQISKGLMGAECELAVDAAHNRVVVSWIDVLASGSSKIGVSISDDDGDTFSAPVLLPPDTSVIKGSEQSDPVVAVDPAGNFFVTWISYDQAGQSATNMNVVVAEAPVGQGFDTFYNVTPATEWTTVADLDKPWIAASPTDGALYATWARLSNFAADIRMSRSADSGQTWSPAVTISDTADRPNVERNLAQIVVGSDGKAYATWIEIGAQQFGATTNQVYVQAIDSDATKLGKNVLVTGGADSPTFDDPSIAVSGSNVYVGFISGTSSGNWDVRVGASLDSAASFQPSVKVNDDATCATHFHHQIVVDGAGNVHAIYYDNRYLVGNVFHQQSPPAATGQNLAFSPVTFVNSATFPFTTSRADQNWLGDYLGLAVGANTLHALWTDPRLGTAQIFYAKASLQ